MNPAVGTMWLTRTAVTSKLSAVNAFSSSNAWYASGAEFNVGRRVKSGNTTSLKMWRRKLSSTSESAWVFTGPSWTRPARVSGSRGGALIWAEGAGGGGGGGDFALSTPLGAVLGGAAAAH